MVQRMETAFNYRQCSRYMTSGGKEGRCECGQSWTYHVTRGINGTENSLKTNETWSPTSHTISLPTDAFGTIDFLDGPHPNKAQYIRLAHDSPCDQILQLLNRGWSIELPKLVISVHGGKANFELNPRIKHVLQTGLLRAAKTTGKEQKPMTSYQ